MTRQEYQSSAKLVGDLRALLEHPAMVIAMQTLIDDGPLNEKTNADTLTETGASSLLGHLKGFYDYPKQLKALVPRAPVDTNVDNDYDERDEQEE